MLTNRTYTCTGTSVRTGIRQTLSPPELPSRTHHGASERALTRLLPCQSSRVRRFPSPWWTNVAANAPLTSPPHQPPLPTTPKRQTPLLAKCPLAPVSALRLLGAPFHYREKNCQTCELVEAALLARSMRSRLKETPVTPVWQRPLNLTLPPRMVPLVRHRRVLLEAREETGVETSPHQQSARACVSPSGT